MKFRLFGGAVAVSVAALLTSPAVAFEGRSVVAPDCNYGGKIKSIVATDEHTVTFSMCSPDPAFKAKAAFVPFGIQPAKHIEEAGPKKKLLENPIGTGPFKLESWNRGDSITMTRNENYWGAKPAYDKLVFRWNQSGAGRLNELRSGTVDEITNISPDDFDGVKNDPDLQFLPQESPNILYLGMVNTAKPFENEKVRQAIAMGIDRQRIVDNFYPKGSVVATHFTPVRCPMVALARIGMGLMPVRPKTAGRCRIPEWVQDQDLLPRCVPRLSAGTKRCGRRVPDAAEEKSRHRRGSGSD